MRIDAHHHFWSYTPEDFGWIRDEQSLIRRDFLPEHLAPELTALGIDGVVTVQARTLVAETEWLLALAERHPFVRGVVGWLPLADDKLSAYLDVYAPHPRLKGLREVLQDLPDGCMDSPAFNRGIAQVQARGLRYDLLILERQLPEAIRFAGRHPDLPIVLDHMAKPRIREKVIEPWGGRMRELARHPNVFCKISGLAVEANVPTWTPEDLRPYFDIAVEAFGPGRLMVGSDWPVCLCATSMGRWIETVDTWIAELSPDEQAAIRGVNAERFYKLDAEAR